MIAGGVNRPVINYQGWFNGGYYHDAASKIKLVKELGSKKELEGLTDKVEAAGGKLYGDVAFCRHSRRLPSIVFQYFPVSQTAP